MNLDSLQKLNFADDAEKSIRETNNWMFGISIGIFVALVFQMNDFDLPENSNSEKFHKVLVVCSMVAIFISGSVKYYLFIRTNKLNVKFAVLKKIIMLRELTDTKLSEEWEPSFNAWVNEFNKFNKLSKFLTLSIISTALLILFFSIFILILIF